MRLNTVDWENATDVLRFLKKFRKHKEMLCYSNEKDIENAIRLLSRLEKECKKQNLRGRKQA